jgi:hypothetical protein
VIDFANLQEPILGSKLPSRVPDNTSEVPDIDPDIWKDESEDDEVRETDPEGDYYFVILCNKFFFISGNLNIFYSLYCKSATKIHFV